MVGPLREGNAMKKANRTGRALLLPILILAGGVLFSPGFAAAQSPPGPEVCANCHEEAVKTYLAHRHSMKADARTPEVRKPDPRKFGPRKFGPRKLGPRRPDARKPDAREPDPGTPDTRMPEVRKLIPRETDPGKSEVRKLIPKETARISSPSAAL